MARVQGVKEKLHSPLYDAFFVPFVREAPDKKFKDFMTDPRVIRFFVDVQNKTRLETNLQAAGVLPSINYFEARAMRVVLSNVPLFSTAIRSSTQAKVAANTGQALRETPKTGQAERKTPKTLPMTSLSLQSRRSAAGPVRQPDRSWLS